MEKSAYVDQNLDQISASLKNGASRPRGDRGLEYSPINNCENVSSRSAVLKIRANHNCRCPSSTPTFKFNVEVIIRHLMPQERWKLESLVLHLRLPVVQVSSTRNQEAFRVVKKAF
jgi:hypothetical protein